MSLGVATLRKKMPKKQRDEGVAKPGEVLPLEPCTSRLLDPRVTTKNGWMGNEEVGDAKGARGHMTRECQHGSG